MQAIRNYDLIQENYEKGWRIDQDYKGKSGGINQYYGIALVMKSDMSVRRWVCLAAPECRDSKNTSSNWINNCYTQSGARHLREQHGYKSHQTMVEALKKMSLDTEYEYLAQSQMYRKNGGRFCTGNAAYFLTRLSH